VAKICLETRIQAPRELVFDLARDVVLHIEGSEATREQAIAGVTSGLLEKGDTVTWRAKHFGIWQELTVAITEFEAPRMFTDEMVKGAFKSIRHVHRFEETDEGTLMIDEFEFTSPLGPLGRLGDLLFLTGYMTRFLRERCEFLKSEAERRSL
jgi:ligand-binding SRPBCC domain-containing protein